MDVMGGQNHAQKVVLHLMKDYLNKGHSVFMDNYYNGLGLVESLLQHKTFKE